MSLIQFISAFGLGAVISALIQAWLASRAEFSRRSFQEKKESYVGFLDALHNSEVCQTDDAALNVGHWKNRIDLVGSHAVISACVRIQETNPTRAGAHPDRPCVLQELKDAMRRDLKVAKRV